MAYIKGGNVFQGNTCCSRRPRPRQRARSRLQTRLVRRVCTFFAESRYRNRVLRKKGCRDWRSICTTKRERGGKWGGEGERERGRPRRTTGGVISTSDRHDISLMPRTRIATASTQFASQGSFKDGQRCNSLRCIPLSRHTRKLEAGRGRQRQRKSERERGRRKERG